MGCSKSGSDMINCGILGQFHFGPELSGGSFLSTFDEPIFAINYDSDWTKQSTLFINEPINNDCVWIDAFIRDKQNETKVLSAFWEVFVDSILINNEPTSERSYRYILCYLNS